MPRSLLALDDDPEPFVVHCHMPKTGGSALNQRLFFPRYGTDRVHQLYRHIFERSSRLPLRHRARAMRSVAATGHVPFGYLDGLYPHAVYVSLFRDPVARFLSFVNFMLATPDHKTRTRLDPKLLDRAADDPDALLRGVLGDDHLGVVHANTQTRLASGTARLGQRPVGGQHLAAALQNIADPRYLTGLQHEFEVFIASLDQTLPGDGLAQPSAIEEKLAKRGHAKITAADLAPKTLGLIRAANDLDLCLIEAVAEQPIKRRAAA